MSLKKNLAKVCVVNNLGTLYFIKLYTKCLTFRFKTKFVIKSLVYVASGDTVLLLTATFIFSGYFLPI